jgi:hypothetical protein
MTASRLYAPIGNGGAGFHLRIIFGKSLSDVCNRLCCRPWTVTRRQPHALSLVGRCQKNKIVAIIMSDFKVDVCIFRVISRIETKVQLPDPWSWRLPRDLAGFCGWGVQTIEAPQAGITTAGVPPQILSSNLYKSQGSTRSSLEVQTPGPPPPGQLRPCVSLFNGNDNNIR